MAFLRRSVSKSSGHPVSEFWAWWGEGGHGLDPSRMSPEVDELNRLVMAINPDLTWHFGPGQDAEHRLTVTSSGVAAVRPAAERWLRAAPSADTRWEFSATMDADPEALTRKLKIEGYEVDLSETVFGIEPEFKRFRADVEVHHPQFAEMEESVRRQIAYMVLDWLLGEDDVERWIGGIDAVTAHPSNAVSGAALTAVVREIEAKRDPDTWALGQWTGPNGLPGLATLRPGIRWLDHPVMDRHQAVSLAYVSNEVGMPANLDGVRAVENAMLAMLGPRGVLVGHESHGGVRTFHIYADSEDQNADADLKAFAKKHRLQITATDDPGWSDSRRFTG
ncbi:DUF695 domain-containing protein [Nocardioides sp. NPDC023903]|uniref:DUF695 domain-containing protein n=1 Tax=Nocardioides sp. NPDC023903 TaxID=3157195 RepID=UPI0033C5CB2C